MSDRPDEKRLQSNDKTQDARQDDAFEREVNRVGKLPQEDKNNEESYTEKKPTDDPTNEYGSAPLNQTSKDNEQFARKIDKPDAGEHPRNPRPAD